MPNFGNPPEKGAGLFATVDDALELVEHALLSPNFAPGSGVALLNSPLAEGFHLPGTDKVAPIDILTDPAAEVSASLTPDDVLAASDADDDLRGPTTLGKSLKSFLNSLFCSGVR